MTDQHAADLISVPNGGGALSGIGETFQPDLHTGTGNLTVPLEVPPGRNGLQPSIALSYSTANPNGPFGLGWSLPVPGVRRKTDKGIPRYDPDHPELDTFVLSGAEDLVAVSGIGTNTVRYRPRSETGYARITHVTGPSGNYWEVWSTGGLRSRYGTPVPANRPSGWADPAIITDPGDPSHIFGWLLSETRDPLGNRIEPLQRAPFLLETTTPGVFAAGDVRHGAIKRVASAVGDGSTAIRLIHDYLALAPPAREGHKPRLQSRERGRAPHSDRMS